MFIGGKNKDPKSEKMATAYIAYDCYNEILVSVSLASVERTSICHYSIPTSYFINRFQKCAAALLNATYMAKYPEVYVLQKNDESWIRLGGKASDPKLKQSTAVEFVYVMKPPDSAYTIGYEGCWNTSGLGVSAINNFVEVSLLNQNS
jgi:hypothetical protein